MKRKHIRIIIASMLVLAVISLVLVFTIENGIKITKENFPEQEVREIAMEADTNNNGILSEKEAGKVQEISLKKFMPQDVIDIMEYQDLPSYTDADFEFDFKGIEHFRNATKLKIDLADGEYFNKESDEQQIYVKTANLENIYELKKLKYINMCEVELETFDIQKFPNLEELHLGDMYNMQELIFAQHSNLKKVWLVGNDKLTSIDFGNLTNLKQAHVRDSSSVNSIKFDKNNSTIKEISAWDLPALKDLNLSFCTSLESLAIREVPLTALDVSDSQKLKYITLYKLSLETFDLSRNLEISELLIEYDATKDIIISDNNQIAWVRWINSDIETFPLTNLNPETLVGLDIQETKIKELDISRYYNLETLYYDKETTTIVGDNNHFTQ